MFMFEKHYKNIFIEINRREWDEIEIIYDGLQAQNITFKIPY